MADIRASLASEETSYHLDVTIRALTSEEPGSSNQPHQVSLPIQAAISDRSVCPAPWWQIKELLQKYTLYVQIYLSLLSSYLPYYGVIYASLIMLWACASGFDPQAMAFGFDCTYIMMKRRRNFYQNFLYSKFKKAPQARISISLCISLAAYFVHYRYRTLSIFSFSEL